MRYAVNRLPMIPIRENPSERSEMISQLLYGEAFEILDNQNSWSLIRCLFDDYTGWASLNQQMEYLDLFDDIPPPSSHFIVKSCTRAHTKNSTNMHLMFGAELRPDDVASPEDLLPNPFLHPETKYNPQNLIELATSLIASPYLWGGRSSQGFDCSGFVQMASKVAGLSMPRDAWQQAELGSTVDFLDEGLPGDLVFFDNAEGKINHVGLLIDSKNVIHASGFVRIDMIDHQGIFNNHLKRYTHKLRIIKRI